jgi:hypothetical protein
MGSGEHLNPSTNSKPQPETADYGVAKYQENDNQEPEKDCEGGFVNWNPV